MGMYDEKVVLCGANSYEEKYGTTRMIMEQLVKSEAFITVVTKSKLVLRDIDLFKKMKHVEVAISISTLDEHLKRKIEPHSSSLEERLETLKKLNGEITDDTNYEDDNEYLTYNSKKNTYTVKKRGTLYFAFYAKNLKTDKFYYVGSFEARLVDSTEATDVAFEGWGMLDDDDDGTEYISVGEKTTYWFDVVPYQYNGTVKVTCSDPKIATVKYKKDKDGANTVVVKGLKKGTVSITVEVNGAKVTMKLKVVNPDFFE